MNMDASLAPRGRNPIHIHLPGGLPGGNQADHPSKVVVYMVVSEEITIRIQIVGNHRRIQFGWKPQSFWFASW